MVDRCVPPSATPTACASPPPVTSYIISRANHAGREPKRHGASAGITTRGRRCSDRHPLLALCPPRRLARKILAGAAAAPAAAARRGAFARPPPRCLPRKPQASRTASASPERLPRSQPRRLQPHRPARPPLAPSSAPNWRRKLLGGGPASATAAVQEQCHVQQLVMTHDPPRTHPHLAAACPAGPLPSPAEATGTRGRVQEWVRVAARAAPAGRAGGGGEGGGAAGTRLAGLGGRGRLRGGAGSGAEGSAGGGGVPGACLRIAARPVQALHSLIGHKLGHSPARALPPRGPPAPLGRRWSPGRAAGLGAAGAPRAPPAPAARPQTLPGRRPRACPARRRARDAHAPCACPLRRRGRLGAAARSVPPGPGRSVHSAGLQRGGARTGTGGAAPSGTGYVTEGVSGGPAPPPLSAVAPGEEGLLWLRFPSGELDVLPPP